MSKEKMVKMEVEIPERWMNFIDEYCQVTGRDRNQELIKTIKAEIEIPFLEDECLSKKDRVRLYDKYQLSDISKLPQWVRDEAAGIPWKPEPRSPWAAAVDKIMGNQKFKEAYAECMKHARTEAFLKAVKSMSPEEKAEVWAATPSA
jgi:hypothetical protein